MKCIKCNSEIPNESIYCNICGKKQFFDRKARKTRGNGQGCVYKLPNGKWRAEKTLGYEIIPDTDPPRKRRVAITRSDFIKKSDAVLFLPLLGTEADKRNLKHSTKIQTSAPDETTITLKELYDIWRPTHKKSRSTMNCYNAGFKIFKDVWNVSMREQNIDDLQDCIDSCEKGKRTRENAKAVLGLIYKFGMPRGYVPNNVAGKPNLAEFLVVGEGAKPQKDGFSADELKTIKNSIGKIPYADYVYCHCYLGFRPSSFIALNKSNYNHAQKAFVAGAKTEAGINRTVTISPKIQPIIDKLLSENKSDVIFPDQNGQALSLVKYREIFYEVLDAAGIQSINEKPPRRLTPHSCRHTFATLMKAIKAPEKDKLKLIGHTSEEMLRHYQDVSYDDLRRITNAL